MDSIITTKNIASVARRPNFSASPGSTRQPRIVPVDSSIVAYDAIRAVDVAGYPDRRATCVTDAGTYTVPAHSPMIETSSSAELIQVRPAYTDVNSLPKASTTPGRRLGRATS